VVRIIDRNNTEQAARNWGRAAIATFWDDICSRAITHSVDTTIAEGDRLAFTQACAYPDGAEVFCAATRAANSLASASMRSAILSR
jgi:hypothetical protein